jgi:hypothetical protein
MSKLFASRTSHGLGRSAVLAALVLAGLSGAAGAVDPRVRSACASDYLSYCSQHDPDGPATRKCMRANGLRLSASCISALVAAGEVSKAETTKRSASARQSNQDE